MLLELNEEEKEYVNQIRKVLHSLEDCFKYNDTSSFIYENNIDRYYELLTALRDSTTNTKLLNIIEKDLELADDELEDPSKEGFAKVSNFYA